MSYVILTDSCANFHEEVFSKLGVSVAPFSFFVNGNEYKSYSNDEPTDLKPFYDMMRNKEHITTSLLGPDQLKEFFRPFLQEGKDVLYLSFSSGLSGSCQSAMIAAEDLKEAFPDRKILVVDTLCASMGQGLLVYYAALLKEKGSSIEEVYDWALAHRLNVVHLFTCDDLFFLKRGGRLSATSAILGSLLQVKPCMRVNDGGKLEVTGKQRGRKQVLQALVNKMAETIIDPEKQSICISHGDCIDEANYVKELILKKMPVKEVFIHYIDPVIGAHSGPGTLAIFFMAKNRE